ncbi:MAG: 2-oxo acid dehydrogenase subunit E2 [Oscillospiraceae bacterium]|nr:2-oxo acid dehydrogenase subunit E2 [Oscillospiraceae bacterium]
MENKTRFYVSLKNGMTWLTVLCMVCSAVARVLFVDTEGVDLWSQIVLPIAAALLYVLICLFNGRERFYKTAIPVWLMCIYFGFTFFGYDFGKYDLLIGTLFAIALLFVAVLYTQISCGKVPATSLIIPLAAFPALAIGYLNRDLLAIGNYRPFLADGLMCLGLILSVFAIKIHPVNEYHPTWGDRADGRRLRSIDPMMALGNYFMPNRNGATNLFSDSIEITGVERYIRQKRKEGYTSFGLTHVLLAAYCRAVCKYPAINRFISGQKVYTHGDDIQFSMTIKKEMTTNAPETTIRLHLDRKLTATEIYQQMNDVVTQEKETASDSDFDSIVRLFNLIPGLVLKFAIWLLKFLDYFGVLPKFLLELSPFHGSVYFTSMGSLGIPPVYHHLYDFGNIPLFCSFGCKRRTLEVTEDGTVVQRKFMDVRVTTDERIVDGFYYASFFKHFKRLVSHPELLDLPPEEVVSDVD